MATITAPRGPRRIPSQTIYWILGALLVVAIVIFVARRTGTMEVPANTGTSAPSTPSDRGVTPIQNDYLTGQGTGVAPVERSMDEGGITTITPEATTTTPPERTAPAPRP